MAWIGKVWTNVGVVVENGRIRNVDAHAAPPSGAPKSVVDEVKDGNAALVKKQLQPHGDPNPADRDGTTALHWAVQMDRLDMVEAHLAGAKTKVTNRQGVAPIGLAVTTSNVAIT